MKCKLTSAEGKGIKAHIIPKSFCAIDSNERKLTKIFTNAKGHYTERSPLGIYDNGIVTEEGERVFSVWDDYAAELLIERKSSFEPLIHHGEVVAFQIPRYEYKKLKLFFLSVLWRASVSTKPFFKNVGLGPHEAKIKEALLESNPKDSDWFSVSIAKWSGHPEGAGMMNPYRTRFEGLNYYVVYLGHYIAYYKVDKRIPCTELQEIQLRENSPLIAVAKDLNTSKELETMARMVKMT